MKQMTLADLKAMFPPPAPHFISNGKKHTEPTKAWKPKNKGRISPAEYRRRHKGKVKR